VLGVEVVKLLGLDWFWLSSTQTSTKVECELQRPQCDVFTVEPFANYIKDADLKALPTCLADAMATATEDRG
jgi:hypothetical protein